MSANAVQAALDHLIAQGDFDTCADPRAYVRAANALFDACIDAIGYEAASAYGDTRDCARAIIAAGSPSRATLEISRRIAAHVAEGATPIDALKAICGAEKVDAMISEVYDALRVRAA